MVRYGVNQNRAGVEASTGRAGVRRHLPERSATAPRLCSRPTSAGKSSAVRARATGRASRARSASSGLRSRQRKPRARPSRPVPAAWAPPADGCEDGGRWPSQLTGQRAHASSPRRSVGSASRSRSTSRRVRRPGTNAKRAPSGSRSTRRRSRPDLRSHSRCGPAARRMTTLPCHAHQIRHPPPTSLTDPPSTYVDDH
jgi:hypothetical protein